MLILTIDGSDFKTTIKPICTPLRTSPLWNKNKLIWAMSWENRIFAYSKTKTQISFAKLISAFVFATYKVQSLYFLDRKFEAFSHLVWLYSPVCVRRGRKPRRPVFSQWGSYIIKLTTYAIYSAIYNCKNHDNNPLKNVIFFSFLLKKTSHRLWVHKYRQSMI